MYTKTKKKLNRIKIVLIQKDKSNTWLSKTMGLTPAAVSRWCTNDAQPSLETLFEIARLLDVKICDLIQDE